MKTTQLKISGMSCGHCVAAVTQALRAVPGVESAEVDFAVGKATIVGQAPLGSLLAAVEEEGYEAEPVPEV